MATTITENTLEGAQTAPQALDPVTAARYGTAAAPVPAANDAARHSTAGKMLQGRLPDLVQKSSQHSQRVSHVDPRPPPGIP